MLVSSVHVAETMPVPLASKKAVPTESLFILRGGKEALRRGGREGEERKGGEREVEEKRGGEKRGKEKRKEMKMRGKKRKKIKEETRKEEKRGRIRT